MIRLHRFCASLLLLALLATSPPAAADTTGEGLVQGEPQEFPSQYLGGSIVVLPGVFSPKEAEVRALPFMKDHAGLFDGKQVLEIGTGSGMISLYAAKLGASKVVATDISEVALRNANLNAERLDVADVLETRLVPQSDMSAYSVIGPDERFDVLISNPPYALDLDAATNTALTDRGDLGLSIVKGLDEHLRPGGVAALLYYSLFYHHVMVKYARHAGYSVRHQIPLKLAPWEAETLFNFYLARLLESEGVGPEDVSFDWKRDAGLDELQVPLTYSRSKPLVEGYTPSRIHTGWMVIKRQAE